MKDVSSPQDAASEMAVKGSREGFVTVRVWHRPSELQTRMCKLLASDSFGILVTLLYVNPVASVSFPRRGDRHATLGRMRKSRH